MQCILMHTVYVWILIDFDFSRRISLESQMLKSPVFLEHQTGDVAELVLNRQESFMGQAKPCNALRGAPCSLLRLFSVFQNLEVLGSPFALKQKGSISST